MCQDMMDPLSKAVTTIAPEVYKDLLQPAAKQIGTTLGSGGVFLNAVLGEGFLVAAEQAKEFWKNISIKIKEKSKNIPPENRIEPELGFLYRAHQGLLTTIGSEALQNLFVNLISGSMDSRTAPNILPVYSEIIQQLTSDEAKILRFLYTVSKGSYPVIDLKKEYKDPSKGGIIVVSNFSDIAKRANCLYIGNTSLYIDNLARLRIIDKPELEHLVREELYKPLEDDIEIKNCKRLIEKDNEFNCVILRGFIRLTEFGRKFCAACKISDI